MTASLQSTFGSAFVGLVVSALLYGVTILQTYLYYRNYPEDNKILKWMVAILWLLDTAHIVLCTISVYTVLVLNFNDPNILLTSTWSMNVQTDFNGLIGLIVEVFYARRVWIVSRNRYLTAFVLILSIIHFGLGIVFTIGRSRTGIQRTDNLISTLMKYSLSTGFLTGIIACLVVLTFGIMPNNFVYVAFFWLLGKCYVNSVLAARESLREKAQSNSVSFLNLSGVPSGARPPVMRKALVVC
ncbi:hypothetical protein C8R45DRAFT_1167774 [Mycena sanguinolenta]|nr:hypothetical protein C8R45DRAFT_1167774 [Mycena sanguinolenta]